MTSQEEAETVVLVHEDGTDTDNLAALKVMCHQAKHMPGVELFIIFEPRPVDFGLATLKPDDQKHLLVLINSHFQHLGKPLEICLNGLLTEPAIDKIENLSKKDKALLHMAINSPKGSAEDSKLHASLMARDLANCINEGSGTSKGGPKVKILVDYDAIPDASPVNLKCHAQEQLFNRTPEEIVEFYSLMEQPDSKREKTRQWYEKCIKEADDKLQNSSFSVEDLNFDLLTERIKAAQTVTFVEGASFNLLSRLVDKPDVAEKIDCVVQAGTLDLSNNIFKNQFNIALDRKSASHVFGNQIFRSFLAIPTCTSQSISFSVDKLEKHGFNSLARWILSFNFREDPLKVAKGTVSLASRHHGKTIKLPDLAMMVVVFDNENHPTKEAKAEVEAVGDESLLFVESESGIPIFLPKHGHTYQTVDVADLLESVCWESFVLNHDTKTRYLLKRSGPE